MRVAILVLGMLIGVLTLAAGSIKVSAAGATSGSAQAAPHAGRDLAANHHRAEVSRVLAVDDEPELIVAGEDAPRLASLDPSQIVYEYVQGPPKLAPGLLSGVAAADGRLLPIREVRVVPRQRPRTAGDFVLMGIAALMLVAYQLRRKHRFLRPHPFGL